MDLRFPLADSRRYPLRWAFCSQACQDAFHTLYVMRHRDDPVTIEELLPVNFPLPPSAQHACIQAIARAAEKVGFEKPLSQYTRPQILGLIEELLRTYERLLHQDTPASPAVDFDDHIPFERGHNAMTTAMLRRVVPSHADLLFFIDGHETCVPMDVPTRLPEADDPLPNDSRWFFPIPAQRPTAPVHVAEVADA